MYDTQTSNMPSMAMNRNSMDIQQSQISQQQMLGQNTNFQLSANNDTSTLQTSNTDHLSNLSGAKKRQQMSRNSRFQFGRRDPPNYDKSTPTQHQTALYNQIIAQQSANKIQLQQQLTNNMATTVNNAPVYNSMNQRYQTADINRYLFVSLPSKSRYDSNGFCFYQPWYKCYECSEYSNTTNPNDHKHLFERIEFVGIQRLCDVLESNEFSADEYHDKHIITTNAKLNTAAKYATTSSGTCEKFKSANVAVNENAS